MFTPSFSPNSKYPLLFNQSFKLNKFNTKFTKKKLLNCSILSAEFGLITSNQLESLRRFISRRVGKKNSKVWSFRINRRLFKKSQKSRMGKGSGKFYRWYGYLRRGSVIFEFTSIYSEKGLNNLKKKFHSVSNKGPLRFFLYFKKIIFSIL